MIAYVETLELRHGQIHGVLEGLQRATGGAAIHLPYVAAHRSFETTA